MDCDDILACCQNAGQISAFNFKKNDLRCSNLELTEWSIKLLVNYNNKSIKVLMYFYIIDHKEDLHIDTEWNGCWIAKCVPELKMREMHNKKLHLKDCVFPPV